MANSSLLTNIENMAIHDASSFHGMTPNASTYTIQLGESDSKYSKSLEVELPTDVNTVLDNLTTNLLLKDSSDSDIECYNKGEVDSSIELIRADVSLYKCQQGEVEEFDPYQSYIQNQLVWYDGQVWRCTVRTFSGQWNPSGWTPTSLYKEIQDMRGISILGMETVNIQASVNRGDGQVAGTTVIIHYDIESGIPDQTYTLDSSGCASFVVEYDTMYTVIAGGLTGYVSPQSTIYKAGMKLRTINLQYRMIGSGIFIIDNNGIETDAELWNPVNNAFARFVKLTNTTLCPGGLSFDNSIVVSKQWGSQYFSSKKWQIEQVNVPSMTNYGSSTAAEADYSGWQNCQNAIYDCSVGDAGGNTLVSRYNEAHPEAPVTIAEYIPAIYFATQVTETFMDRTVTAYLPSMGQLRMLLTNIDDFNNALVKIGSSALGLGSGRWWSSSQSSATYAWFMYNTTTNYNLKFNSYVVLPIFAL